MPADQLVKAITSVRYPVYWLGRNFEGLPITSMDRDPAGAYDAAYGHCLEGGQGTCVTPVLIVTSPDNSFVPGGDRGRPHTTVRGLRAVMAQNARTLQIPTGPVIVNIYASSAALARQVAEEISPMNQPGSPAAPLPPPLPDTGYGQTPLGSRDTPPPPNGTRRPGRRGRERRGADGPSGGSGDAQGPRAAWATRSATASRRGAIRGCARARSAGDARRRSCA